MTTLLLQRQLERGRRRWVTTLAFDPSESPRVQRAAEALALAGPVAWRVVEDVVGQPTLAVYDGARWVPIGGNEPAGTRAEP